MSKHIYTYAEFNADGKPELCQKINRKIGRGERVFSIDFICGTNRGAWYGVVFEKQPSLKLAKIRAFKTKKARPART